MGDMRHPLVPPELLHYTLLRETSQADHRKTNKDVESSSLLRFLSTPGHRYGEGYRRIYIGHHPDDDYEYLGDLSDARRTVNNDDGSRTFLVGVQALWELHRREQRRQAKGKGREECPTSPTRHAIGNGNATTSLATSKYGRHSSSLSDGISDTDNQGGGSLISESSGSSEDEQLSSPPTSLSKHLLRGFPGSKKQGAPSTAAGQGVSLKSIRPHGPSVSDSSPDGLLQKLSSSDARRKLSSGVSEQTGQALSEEDESDDGVPATCQDILSRRAQESPKHIGDASSSTSFQDARSFLTEGGKRATRREVSDDVKEKVRESFAPSHEPESAARHELLRRISDTLVPETASDTFVISSKTRLNSDYRRREVDHVGRPVPPKLKSGKSVRWDISQEGKLVPAPRGRNLRLPGPGSGDRPAGDPSQVLSRPEPLEQPAEQVPDNIPPLAQLARYETSDSARELARLAGVKEASLPPGVEKLERMIIRACWTKQEVFPQDFDELAGRKLALAWTPWEEVAVLWKKNHLEIYGTHHDPYHRFLTRDLALKYVIPLKSRLNTALSVYSVADQIFCLRCPPHPLGGHHLSGKAGRKNKRHVNSAGTNLFLFRARATSIAEDWYLGLHLALEKEHLETVEVYLAGLGVRIRMPTNVAAHDAASASAVVSATRQLMSAGLPDRDLVSKEEMLQSARDLISHRQDWKELLDHIENQGLGIKLAWRRGMVLDWLSIDRSVDGVKRIWDVYTGAVMKQANEPVHRLEILPEKHYPTIVQISPGVQNIEPPAIEGYITRLRHRNENQRERMYIGTVGGSLAIFKASKARPPPFPDRGAAHHIGMHNEDNQAFHEIRSATAKHSQHKMVQEYLAEENVRLNTMLERCKGLIRMRDIISVELDDTCQYCRGKDSLSGSKLAATSKGRDHEHMIVQLNLSEDRQFRFETTPKEAAREWVGRLKGLVEYWTRREQGDAQVQLSLSSCRYVKHFSKPSRHEMPAFQQRELEDSSTGTDVYEPLLSQAFNYCVQNGCRNNILMQGRLYHKKGHRDAVFLDRYIILLDNNLIIFESVRRNLSKRPVPLVYHRRIKTLRLRDIYVVTGDGCSQYFRKAGQNDFNPSTDRSSAARIYKDGLVAVDDPMDCTFMLWCQRPSGNGTKLGRNGKVNLFRARSRLERDQWVQAFNVMCEAYGRTTREREVRLATFNQIK